MPAMKTVILRAKLLLAYGRTETDSGPQNHKWEPGKIPHIYLFRKETVDPTAKSLARVKDATTMGGALLAEIKHSAKRFRDSDFKRQILELLLFRLAARIRWAIRQKPKLGGIFDGMHANSTS